MKIGDTVEDFELPGTNGAFRLSAAADKIVVLYIFIRKTIRPVAR